MKTWMLLLMVVMASSGCMTSKSASESGKTQIQMAQLERKVDENEDQLKALSERIDELEEGVNDIDSYPVQEPQVRSTTRSSQSVASVASSGDGEIIRVAVSPERVQTALKSAGYYNGPIDGRIGSGTKSAIRDFQKENNLNADGILGRKTWAELQKYLD